MYSEDEMNSLEAGSLEEKPAKTKAKRGRNVKSKVVAKNNNKKPKLSSEEEEEKPKMSKWKKNLKETISSDSDSDDLEDNINSVISLSQATDIWFSRFHGVNYLHLRNKRKNRSLSLNQYEVKKLNRLYSRIRSIFANASCE